MPFPVPCSDVSCDEWSFYLLPLDEDIISMELPEFFRDYFLVSRTILPGCCPAGRQPSPHSPLGPRTKELCVGSQCVVSRSALSAPHCRSPVLGWILPGELLAWAVVPPPLGTELPCAAPSNPPWVALGTWRVPVRVERGRAHGSPSPSPAPDARSHFQPGLPRAAPRCSRAPCRREITAGSTRLLEPCSC